jgi:hypothetical protein
VVTPPRATHLLGQMTAIEAALSILSAPHCCKIEATTRTAIEHCREQSRIPYSCGETNKMNIATRVLVHSALVIFTAGLVVSCSEPSTPSASTSPADSHFDLRLNMQDFMNNVLEPVSDVLWDSAGWVDDINTGYEELYPKNDAEWLLVKQKAAQLIEAGNALALPGRAVDNDAWITYSNALSTAAGLAYDSAQTQNREDFFQAGAQIYSVCTACHQGYNPAISRFVSN